MIVGRSFSVSFFLGRVFKTGAFTRRGSFIVRCIVTEGRSVINVETAFRKSISNTHLLLRKFSTPEKNEGALDRLAFENVCAQTLDSLSEYFEELVETVPALKHADVVYSDGVLTVNLGKTLGTYVINRQTPNLQIWLSSPTSGPKRYDFLNGTWIYKHDRTSLHSLLDKEIKEIANEDVHFSEKCLHGKASP